MSRRGPPPPPPAPEVRGRPQPPAGFIDLNRRAPPPPLPPPGAMRPGPPLPLPPPAPPIINSVQVSDITPRKNLTADDCRKKLTSYTCFSIRKLVTTDQGTWAKAEFIHEVLAPEEIAKQLKRLNEKGPSVAEKKAKLFPFQHGQVTRVLDNQINSDRDPNFEWSLAQLDREERRLKDPKKKETTSIIVYLKRTPAKGVDPIALQQAIERIHRPANEALAHGQPPAQERPSPPPAHLHPPPAAQRIPNRRSRSRHSDSSSDVSHDSDDSRTTRSTDTQDSSISSGSHYRRRPNRHARSHSRHRIYRQHYLGDRAGRYPSPERVLVQVERQYIPVPEPPGQAPVQALDAVAAAYQAGRVDADADRIGLRDRYSPSPRAERAIVHQAAHFADPHEDDWLPPQPLYGRPLPRDYTTQEELIRRRVRDREDHQRRYVEADDHGRRPRLTRYGSFEPFDESPQFPAHFSRGFPFRARRYPPSSDTYSYA